MAVSHKVGISSFAYSFGCGSRPFQKPERLLTPFDLIDKALDIGAEVLQFGDNVPLEVYTDEELESIRIYAEESEIELEVGMRKATEARLKNYLKITQKTGAHFLRLITDGVDFQPDFQEFCIILLSVIPQLEESGVVLGIENHDRFLVNEYAHMMEAVDHPQIGITVDSVNSLSTEEPLDEVLKYLAPFCVCLHVKDYVIKRSNGGGGLKITGARLGTGRLDIHRCFEECRISSSRDFNIILESWMEPCGTLEETLRMEDEWARAGVRYLKQLVSSTEYSMQTNQ